MTVTKIWMKFAYLLAVVNLLVNIIIFCFATILDMKEIWGSFLIPYANQSFVYDHYEYF
jgi:hypothetical protein